MPTDLTDPETDVIVRLLRQAIDNDRDPLSPRIQEMKAILDKLGPEPERQPLPVPLRNYAPPRVGRYAGAGEIRARPTRDTREHCGGAGLAICCEDCGHNVERNAAEIRGPGACRGDGPQVRARTRPWSLLDVCPANCVVSAVCERSPL